MKGDPIDLTPFGTLLSGIGFFYWALAALGLWWALRGSRPWRTKLLRTLPFALLFGLVPGLWAWRELKQRLELSDAMALFSERCKTAGEKIVRTVDHVDGIVWLKWRDKTSTADNAADQWKLNDPYGQDCGLEGCILQLLRPTGTTDHQRTGVNRAENGYRFVETSDLRDGSLYRYTATLKSVAEVSREEFVQHIENTGHGADGSGRYAALSRIPISHATARYGVVWADISKHEDREHWIAGSSLKVIDLQTNELLAERVGYMVDPGQGSEAGGRSPWLFAAYTACPPFDLSESRSPIKMSRSSAFVFKVLRSAKGE